MTYTDYRQTLDILYDAIQQMCSEPECSENDLLAYYKVRNAIRYIESSVPEHWTRFERMGAN